MDLILIRLHVNPNEYSTSILTARKSDRNESKDVNIRSKFHF